MMDKAESMREILETQEELLELVVKEWAKYWPNYSFSEAQKATIKRFLAKLEFLDIIDAVRASAVKVSNSSWHAFEYFCGICWSKIKEGGLPDEQ